MTILSMVNHRGLMKEWIAYRDMVGASPRIVAIVAACIYRIIAFGGRGRLKMIIAGLVMTVTLLSCSTDPVDDPITAGSFPDKVINLNLPENIGLRSKGTSKIYNDIGVRGVIVYCIDVGVYHAYERTCSYQPNEACATVNIDVSTLFMVDSCCGSMFDFNTGMPSGGVAWRPLLQYRTMFSGSDLVITDEVVE